MSPSSPAPSPTPAPTPTPTPTPPSQPPTASIADVEPFGVALIFATRVSFNGAGTSPNGFPLTFNWDFGDGSTGSGTGISHVYNKLGSILVKLTVADDHGGMTTVQKGLTTGSTNGTWDSCCVDGFQTTGGITQNGSSVSGAFPNFSFTGALSDPRAMNVSLVMANCTKSFSGGVGDSLNDLSLTGLDCLNHSITVNFTRKGG